MQCRSFCRLSSKGQTQAVSCSCVVQRRTAVSHTKLTTWRQWQWFPVGLAEKKRIVKSQKERKAKWLKNQELPEYFTDPGAMPGSKKQLKVIFIQDMDEYVAGQIATVASGLYRSWLWPRKIALPATDEFVQRFGHLNHELRSEMEHKRRMDALAEDISQLRMELRIRRDPERGDLIHSRVTKAKICRELLLRKKIAISPTQITLMPYGIGKTQVDENGRLLKEFIAAKQLSVVDSEGSYFVLLDSGDLQFSFRLNVRCSDVPLERNAPELDISEYRSWHRAKRAHELVDDITRPNSRYADLYPLSEYNL